ncbi:hypothetical protein FGE05_27315 [Pseudomonas sp. ICMP22404]|nr:hypothetical protein FGE05_27315 [Pseudomonas sp. ICMP22404]
MLTKVPWVSGGQKGAHYIGFFCEAGGAAKALWRGDLSPLGCEAAPKIMPHRHWSIGSSILGAASRPSGDKSPRHKKPLDQWVRATANSLNSTRASRYSLAGRASRHLIARAT